MTGKTTGNTMSDMSPTSPSEHDTRGLSLLRDIGGALEVAGVETDAKPLPLTPDFAEVVAEIRGVLSLAEIGEVAGVKERQVHHWLAGTHNPTGDARSRLLALFRVIGYLQLVLSDERIKVWL